MFKWLRVKFLKWQELRLTEEIEACEWFIRREPENTPHCEALADLKSSLDMVKDELKKLSPN